MQARRLQVDHRRRACVVTVAALAATGGFVAASARTRAPGLSVLSFNVLAPLWAAPQWYPASLNPSVLDRDWRRGRIAAFLADAGHTHDLVCLQEVELQELPAYEQALGPAFVGAFASHDRSYWSSWLVPQLPWVPNGNALFVRRQTVLAPVFTDFSLGDTGNHAVAFSGTLASSGRLLRAASVHLDSDSNVGRRIELDALLALTPPAAGSVDIIAGDINEDTVIGSAAGLLRAAGFVDVLAALGNRDPTHPFRASYNRSPRWAIIDHVLARGVAPRSGDVFDFGLGAIDDEVPTHRGELSALRVGPPPGDRRGRGLAVAPAAQHAARSATGRRHRCPSSRPAFPRSCLRSCALTAAAYRRAPPRRARAAPLATGGDQPVVAAVAAAQAQEAVGQDAALQERVELIVHELRQVGSGSGLSLREDGRGVLLHRSSCTSPRTTTPAGSTASCRARGAT